MASAYERMGRRLREAREAAGLTIAEAAAASELNEETLRAYESGERIAGLLELVRLAKLYGRPVSCFLADVPPGAYDSAGGYYLGEDPSRFLQDEGDPPLAYGEQWNGAQGAFH